MHIYIYIYIMIYQIIVERRLQSPQCLLRSCGLDPVQMGLRRTTKEPSNERPESAPRRFLRLDRCETVSGTAISQQSYPPGVE